MPRTKGSKNKVEEEEVSGGTAELEDELGQPLVGVKTQTLGKDEIEGFDPKIT